jgi:hypothetical protein
MTAVAWDKGDRSLEKLLFKIDSEYKNLFS